MFTAYNITFAALLLLAGKLGDRMGPPQAPSSVGLVAVRRRLAARRRSRPSIWVLIAGRVLQAIGSALIYPASLALLLPAVPAVAPLDGDRRVGRHRRARRGDRPDARRAARRGGRLAGRVLHQPAVRRRRRCIGGWRCCRATGERRRERFDPVAVPLAALAVGAARARRSSRAADWGWATRASLVCLVVAAVLLPLFFLRSARHPAPLLDLDLFRLRSFTVGNIAQALFVGSTFGWLVLMPSFFVRTCGAGRRSPPASGWRRRRRSAPSCRRSPGASPTASATAGSSPSACICGAVGTLWWVAGRRRARRTTSTAILPGMVLAGLGITAGFATLTGALMSRIPPRFYSMAGAARSTLFQLATAIGIAVAVALQSTRRRRRPGGAVPEGVAGRDGVRGGLGRRDAGGVPPPGAPDDYLR